MHQVSADYTRALGIAVLKGRALTTADIAGRRQVALVNQAFERTRFDRADAVGRIVRLPRLTQPPIGAADPGVEIVGVVHDTLNRGITDALLPEIYIPYSLLGAANRVVVQTAGDPAGVTRAVVERVYTIDRDQPVTEVRTIEAFLNEFIYAGPRFNVVLLSVFASLGLILSVVGIYGVMAHTVTQQTREIGVRIALGADPGSVGRMVVRSGAVLLVTGIALGLRGQCLRGQAARATDLERLDVRSDVVCRGFGRAADHRVAGLCLAGVARESNTADRRATAGVARHRPDKHTHALECHLTNSGRRHITKTAKTRSSRRKAPSKKILRGLRELRGLRA